MVRLLPDMNECIVVDEYNSKLFPALIITLYIGGCISVDLDLCA